MVRLLQTTLNHLSLKAKPHNQVTTRSASKHALPQSTDNEPSPTHKRPRHSPKSVQTSRTTMDTRILSSPPISTISTVGHGTRHLRDLTGILQTANTSVLVDIRSMPRSWTNPQFNREALSSSSLLQELGILYKWMGDSLGGRRNAQQPNIPRHTALRVAAFKNYAGYMSTASFHRGLEELKALSKEKAISGGTVTIMCSETLWWRCHRRMLADKLVTEGWAVRHLGIKKGEAPKHELWNVARVEADGEIVYDR